MSDCFCPEFISLNIEVCCLGNSNSIIGSCGGRSLSIPTKYLEPSCLGSKLLWQHCQVIPTQLWESCVAQQVAAWQVGWTSCPWLAAGLLRAQCMLWGGCGAALELSQGLCWGGSSVFEAVTAFWKLFVPTEKLHVSLVCFFRYVVNLNLSLIFTIISNSLAAGFCTASSRNCQNGAVW